MATATATFSPVVPADQVTSRQVNWTLNGTTTTHTLTPGVNMDTLACNPGDTVSFDVDDVNVVGASPDSNILTGTVPLAPPTAVPTTPTALTLTFA